MEILANIIAFLHLVLVIFIVSTPFLIDNTFLLLFYSFIVFSIMFHWITNNDACVLTLIESKLRNKKSNQTFMGRLISPVYRISSTEIRLATLALFLFALYKSRIWDKEKLNEIITLANLKYMIFKKNMKQLFNTTVPADKEMYHSERVSQTPLQELGGTAVSVDPPPSVGEQSAADLSQEQRTVEAQ